MGNTFGHTFRVTTWGESHGDAVGVVVDGCPPLLDLGIQDIRPELDRRRPGQSAITTQRKETDRVEIQSDVFAGKTLGTPHLSIPRPAAISPCRLSPYAVLCGLGPLTSHPRISPPAAARL